MFNLTLTGFNLMIYAELQCGNKYLCEVEKFIGVTVLSNNNDYCTVWLAVVSVYMLHKQRDFLDIWFKFGH